MFKSFENVSCPVATYSIITFKVVQLTSRDNCNVNSSTRYTLQIYIVYISISWCSSIIKNLVKKINCL